jgi:endonuclease/exonuclease/phosphatase family metal-dependent hydrolase
MGIVSSSISVGASAAGRTGPEEIRILTVNVWSGLTYRGILKMGRYPDDLPKRHRLLVTEIRRHDPHIIAIQEGNPLPSYAKRLSADLNYEVIYRVALGGVRFGPLGIPTNLREGDLILRKKPSKIEDLGRRRLSGFGIATNWFCFHFGQYTQVLLGRMLINGQSFFVYNVHLHAGPFRGPALDDALECLSGKLPREKIEEAIKGVEKDIERRKGEIANLIGFVKETLPQGMPAILLGDFNTTIESGELQPLLPEGWVDSFRFKNPSHEGVTWDPPRNPNFREREALSDPHDLLRAYHDRHSYRIDFIFLKNISQERILVSRVVMTPVEGLCPSDHYGVLTTLSWNNRIVE